jgi:putative Mg2+ transporter-C (MgtC) family protein
VQLIPPEETLILIELVVAMLLGALIGLDREAAEKPAGLRTHMLVAGAASLLISIGQLTVDELTIELGNQVIRTDPIRIMEAIITGVSFLGAGTIIRQTSGEDVKGLTTAASLLFASVIGISVALQQWFLAISATVFVLIVLRVLPILERFLIRRKSNRD